MSGGERRFDWAALVPHFIHPLKVVIIEAMVWIDRPISAAEISKCLDEFRSISLVSYHMVKLAEAGAIVKVDETRVAGGVLQRLYYFPDATK